MEKKNIAGYITGLISIAGGTYIGARGLVGAMVGIENIMSASSSALTTSAGANALFSLLPLAAGVALITVGGKSIVNTFRGNRKTDLINDVKDMKTEVKSLKEELSNGIDKTPQVEVQSSSKEMLGTEKNKTSTIQMEKDER